MTDELDAAVRRLEAERLRPMARWRLDTKLRHYTRSERDQLLQEVTARKPAGHGEAAPTG